MKAIKQYLERYAESEVQSLAQWPPEQSFLRSLVIPAYDEDPGFIDRLKDSCLAQNLLLILVINRPDNVDLCTANDQLITYLDKNFETRWQQDSLSLLGSDEFGILSVDRHKQPIPHKQGVGLARKIGCDLAASLIFKKNINSHWIHSTDADAHLPNDYFQTDSLTDQHAGATYQFEHIKDSSDIAKATELYEQTLHHYVDGLARAQSPYAFHTIGSILAINYRQYCQARGFPKRSGGEDFYLLNKLRKLGAIASLPAKILLEPRESHRVPFGTGPATAKILQAIDQHETITTYNPEVFNQLAIALKTLTDTIATQGTLANALAGLSPQSQQALASLNLEQCFSHLASRDNQAWQLRHFHDWFDAFRTLKFIRFLQTTHWPNIPLDGQSSFECR